MKNFSRFISEAKSFSVQSTEEDCLTLSDDEIREQYILGNIFKEDSLVEKIETGEIGKVTRRGTNYLICVTENNEMFRAWITDVREVFEVGTCEYRKHAQQYTPGQPIKPFTGKIKIKSSYK